MRRWLLLLPWLAACADTDGDGDRDAIDCAPLDASQHREAAEVCNGVDDDCDGAIDDGVGTVVWRDADGDGYGDPFAARRVCQVPEDGVLNDRDCDDQAADVSPDRAETCDGRDEDCDGAVDEGAERPWYVDVDGDGHGAPSDPIEACFGPEGYAPASDDCDDADPAAWTDAPERCDGHDQDCDGQIDEDLPEARVWIDADGDGAGDPARPTVACGPLPGLAAADDDCDDDDAARAPGVDEDANLQDDDCDGFVDEQHFADVGSLQLALDLDAEGGVYQLRAGTHVGVLAWDRSDVTVVGEGCDATTLYGDHRGSVVTMGGGALSRLRVTGGDADLGGGVLVDGDAALSDVCVDGNVARRGGGIALLSGEATLEGVWIAHNTADEAGGGLLIEADARATVRRAQLLGNQSGNDGGGAAVLGELRADATLWEGNRAVDDGGGLWIGGAAAASLAFVTLVGNRSGSEGGAVFAAAPSELSEVLFVGNLGAMSVVYGPGLTVGAVQVFGQDDADHAAGWWTHAKRDDPRLSADHRRVESGAPWPEIGACAGPDAWADCGWGWRDDSDADGLTDGWEWTRGGSPWTAEGPLDRDHDGLSDVDEAARGTSDRLADSDDDGRSDAAEVDDGSNPTDPSDHAPTAAIDGPTWWAVGVEGTWSASDAWDPDEATLIYVWTLAEVPPGAQATLAASGAQASFTPDVAGSWRLRLTIDDGTVERSVERHLFVASGVRVPEDAETLALAVADPAAPAVILLAPGRYEAAMFAQADRTLVGRGAPGAVILDAWGRGRAIDVRDADLTLANLTVTGGYADDGGAVRLVNGTFAADHVVFEGNRARRDGGAVYLADAVASWTDVAFVANEAQGRGGGVRSVQSVVDAARFDAHRNLAGVDGGAWSHTGRSGERAVLRNARFVENRAPIGPAAHRDGYGLVDLRYPGISGHEGPPLFNGGGDLWVQGGLAVEADVAPIAQLAAGARSAWVHGASRVEPDVGVAFIDGATLVGAPFVTLDGDRGDDRWGRPPPASGLGRTHHRDLDGRAASAGPAGGPDADPRDVGFGVDLDRDGLSDKWERGWAGSFTAIDGEADPDDDGLIARIEQAVGTCPVDADSDGDGVADGVERAEGTSPTDPADHAPRLRVDAALAVRVGVEATIDASGSDDPDGDPLMGWRWIVGSAPAGSTWRIGEPLGAIGPVATFTPDVRGEYRILVTVSDGQVPVTAAITVHGWGTLRVPEVYPTVDDALAEALPGDEVLVGAGRWPVAADLAGGDWRVRGVGADATILVGPRDAPPLTVSEGGRLSLDSLAVERGLGARGGLIACEDSTLDAADVEFRGGVATQGGALGLIGCQTTLARVRVVDSRAENRGGGVYVEGGALSWVGGRLVANRSTNVGGGLAASNGAVVDLRGVVVSGNRAWSTGAGVLISSGAASLRFCTVDDNRGSLASVAVDVQGGVLVVEDTLFTANAGYPLRATTTQGRVQRARLGFWGNVRSDPSLPGDVIGEPDYQSDHRLGPRSAFIDPADAASSDPDGTSADLGAWGGPDAPVDFDLGYRDLDADGLPDAWESLEGGGADLNAGDDLDVDGLSAADEWILATSPIRADTDADGWDDGVEAAGGGDPVDPTDHAPWIEAMSPEVIDLGEEISIDMGGSFDPDGASLAWSAWVADAPGRSTWSAGDPVPWAGDVASFAPDQAGLWRIITRADDGSGVTEREIVVRVRGVVQVPGDYGSVASAVDASADGGEIVIDDGVWPCSVDLGGRSLRIVGAGPDRTVLDAEDRGPVVQALLGETVDLSGLTLTGGLDPRGGAVRAATLMTPRGAVLAEDVVFDGNHAIYGGAAYLDDVDLVLTDVIARDGVAVSRGGGLWSLESPIDAVRVELLGLTAGGNGGGVYLRDAPLTGRNLRLSDLIAAYGGGIYADGAGQGDTQVALDYVTATGLRADLGAGGVWLVDGADLAVSGSIFAGAFPTALGRATGSGQAVAVDYSVFFEAGSAAWPSGATVQGAVVADPQFAAWSDDGDPHNDDLGLRIGSAAVDAGPPDARDSDGSRADAGFTGGPDAR